MKLTSEQIQTATESLGFDAIAEQHPVHPQLEKALGEHTFFINDNGLFVFNEHSEENSKEKTARLYVVAAWTDDEKKALSPVTPPSPVDVVFDLDEGKISGGEG